MILQVRVAWDASHQTFGVFGGGGKAIPCISAGWSNTVFLKIGNFPCSLAFWSAYVMKWMLKKYRKWLEFESLHFTTHSMLQLKLVFYLWTHCYFPHNFLVQSEVAHVYSLSPLRPACVSLCFFSSEAIATVKNFIIKNENAILPS